MARSSRTVAPKPTASLTEITVQERVGKDDSARKSLQTFTRASGRARYENEAIFAQQNGQDIDYIVPDSTILIENPVAITSSTKHPEQAKAFLDYALSPTAQQKFADWGYRPVDEAVFDKNKAKFPTPGGLFTIRDLGGWGQVNDEFFDPDKGSVAKIEEAAGVSTAK